MSPEMFFISVAKRFSSSNFMCFPKVNLWNTSERTWRMRRRMNRTPEKRLFMDIKVYWMHRKKINRVQLILHLCSAYGQRSPWRLFISFTLRMLIEFLVLIQLRFLFNFVFFLFVFALTKKLLDSFFYLVGLSVDEICINEN